jgi:hypothetical protein
MFDAAMMIAAELDDNVPSGTSGLPQCYHHIPDTAQSFCPFLNEERYSSQKAETLML